MVAFMIIKGNIICWHFLKALPSANTFHCILREITVYFSDEVFSLKIWGHFIQQCGLWWIIVLLLYLKQSWNANWIKREFLGPLSFHLYRRLRMFCSSQVALGPRSSWSLLNSSSSPSSSISGRPSIVQQSILPVWCGSIAFSWHSINRLTFNEKIKIVLIA